MSEKPPAFSRLRELRAYESLGVVALVALGLLVIFGIALWLADDQATPEAARPIGMSVIAGQRPSFQGQLTSVAGDQLTITTDEGRIVVAVHRGTLIKTEDGSFATTADLQSGAWLAVFGALEERAVFRGDVISVFEDDPQEVARRASELAGMYRRFATAFEHEPEEPVSYTSERLQQDLLTSLIPGRSALLLDAIRSLSQARQAGVIEDADIRRYIEALHDTNAQLFYEGEPLESRAIWEDLRDMAGFVGSRQDVEAQADFFDAHVWIWLPAFCEGFVGGEGVEVVRRYYDAECKAFEEFIYGEADRLRFTD